MGAEQFVAMGFAFFVGIAVFRYLGPQATGALSFAGAIAGLLLPLATLGLEPIIVRELAKEGGPKSEIWHTAQKALWAVTALQIVLLAGLAFTQSAGSLQQVALWATTVSCFANVSHVHLWAFRAGSRYRELARVRLLQTVAMQMLRLGLVYLGAPFLAFAVLLALDPLLIALVTRQMARTRLGDTIGTAAASWIRMRSLLAESWPLILTGFGIMIYTRIDVVMLEGHSGVEAVGFYSAATRLTEVWNLVPVILVRAAYPRLVQMARSEPARYTQIYRRMFLFFAFSAIVLVAATQLSGKTVIAILYGEEYAGSEGALMIHIWSAIPVFMGVLISTAYQIFRATKALMWGCLAGSVSNILLNLLWIPGYGIKGAAAATVVSYTLSTAAPLLVSGVCRRIALGRMIQSNVVG